MDRGEWSSWPAGEAPRSAVRPASSGVTLWRPDVVLADRKQRIVPPRRLITPGEPAFRPEAVRAQVDAAKALLRSFTHAHELLDAEATRAETRGAAATSDRERVSATMETYRLKAEMDDMLKGTLRRMTALMEGRNVR